MKRMQMIGLALVAVFAMAAVVASAASAQLPEFVRCAKVAAGEPSSWEAGCTTAKVGGGFAKVSAGPGLCVKVAPGEPSSWANATCTTAGTGFIKIAAAGKPKFKSTSGTSILEATNEKITCTADTNEGELTGDQTDKVVVKFTGCTALGGLAKCQNTATKGEIVTRELESTLGYIKKAAPTEVGLSLKPKGGGLFAEFTCEALGQKETLKVGEGFKPEKGAMEGGDSVIGKITPINTWVIPPTAFTLTFKCKAANIQEFEKFEGGPLDVLESFKEPTPKEWERACETTTDTITFEEAGEIRA